MSHRPLRELIARLQELQLLAAPVSTDVIITSAPSHDSRLVMTGGIFVAIPGRTADGATFITSAAERGAVAVLCEQQVASSVPLVVVRDARAALAVAAAWWEGDPAEELVAIGVTGTDGKTTTSTFLSTALTAAGLRTGLISTAISRVGGTQRAAAAHQTTPESPALQRALREMVEAGDEAAVVESTSHGLQLERVGAINFASAMSTEPPRRSSWREPWGVQRVARANCRAWWWCMRATLPCSRSPMRQRRLGCRLLDSMPTRITRC